MNTPFGDLMVWDAHTHFLSHTFFQKLAREAGLSQPDGTGSVTLAGQRLGWEMPPEDPVPLARRWVEEMSRHGVDRSILFGSLPGEEEAVAAACRAFPHRLTGFSMVNPLTGDPAAAARRVADL
ncbi:MAG: amidohydrolase, partial [Candidatus Eremiobacterota bacterium]